MNHTAKKIQPSIRYPQFSSGIEDFDENYKNEITETHYFGFPIQPILQIENQLISQEAANVAYFSMEFGIAPSIYNSLHLSKRMNRKNHFNTHEVFSNQWQIDSKYKILIHKMLDIPIYGGGLGVLAGDSMKSAADLGYSVAGLGILWNKGYFKQEFWYKYGQIPTELTWDPHSYPGLIPLKKRVIVQTKERELHLRLWKYYVYSYDKTRACPIILMDSNLKENEPHYRKLTDQLYRSDDIWWKAFQRIILGIGGMKALEVLGYDINKYHLNEGHAAFALVEKVKELKENQTFEEERKNFVYTCHTPVAAGHDRFASGDVAKILDEEYVSIAEKMGKENIDAHDINLTHLCLTQTSDVNAVSKKHLDVMKIQFPEFSKTMKSITNGVHMHTWLSESFSRLFDQYKDTFGDWRANPEYLSRILELKKNDSFRFSIFEAHQENKQALVDITHHWGIDKNVFTIGWARRITGYKRPALIFHNVKRIIELAKKHGPVQLIIAGKAHPNDDIGGAKIGQILDHIEELQDYKDLVKVLILENYDTYFGKLLTNSVDVWLNNPLPPFEASGTSGMKAILNGVLQVSTLDGWVAEADYDNIGWIFGYRHAGNEIGSERELRLGEDSESLYKTLDEVLSLYYKTNKDGEILTSSSWIDKMIHCVEQSAIFNTQRMLKEYKEKMWLTK